jgi:uncharacterized membrane protein YjgN (DUF898 family)
VGALALPWIVAQSIGFNARATVWRGLHFGFDGRSGGALRVFLLLPLASLGVFWPFAARSQRGWLVNNHRYGSTRFSYDTSVSELYGIYFRSLIFFLPAGLSYLGVLLRRYIELKGGEVEMPLWLVNIVVVGPEIWPFTLLLALGGIDFLRARLFTFHWNGTAIGGHAINAYMAPWDVFRLRLLNAAAMTFSLGLLWPWMQVHNRIFMLSCLDFAPASSLGDLTAGDRSRDRTDALADSVSDFFNLDIGL